MEVQYHSQLKNNITVVFALLSCVTATAQFNEAEKTPAVAMAIEKAWTPKGFSNSSALFLISSGN
ncbi:MAG TPA: hypothetical protein VFU29_08785 [Chitinophagaceae bacterium]|nr:hypothetical protein [Chitinophagaceae bacterium]